MSSRQPCARMSASVVRISASVSPRPSISPVLVGISGRRRAAFAQHARASARSGRPCAPASAAARPSRGCGSARRATPRARRAAPRPSPSDRGSGPRPGSPARARGSRATVRAKCAAPPSSRSSRATAVTTAKRSPSRATAAADARRLVGSSALGPARLHVAEAAGARAQVAADHERGRAVRPALAEVRARGGLADGVEPLLAHEREQALELGRLAVADAQPARAIAARAPVDRPRACPRSAAARSCERLAQRVLDAVA